MKNLAFLTCTPKQSEDLVELGIDCTAFMWHEWQKDATNGLWEVAIFKTPVRSASLLPAYTKQELDAMIGNDFDKPDMYRSDQITKATIETMYPVMFPTKMQEYKNGAQASAAVLIYLLTAKALNPVKVNERYLKMFP